MKHGELRSIAHNAAASLASGNSFFIGVYDLDVFGDARQSSRNEIIVDFLRGTVIGAPPNSRLAEAAARLPKATRALCEKHGVQIESISEMRAKYWFTPQGGRFVVTVADTIGRRSTTDYSGWDGKRTMLIDGKGRLRPHLIRRV